MSKLHDLVRREVELYRDYSELWKTEHNRAMACYKFEDLLAKGIQAFEDINRYDELYRSGVYSGRVKSDQKVVDGIKSLYALWLLPRDYLTRRMRALEKDGFKIKNAKEFRSCCREAVGILTPDEEFFQGEKLVQLRDAAIDANRQGDVSECPI